jgi:BirA family transcriptional regulator, biotin operon repressor / biotin---[acetyl-CoA-carboxylase] ligase
MFKPIGQKIIHLERVDSTNNYAAILISEAKGTHGTVILADEQTAGRGQRGAEWSSKPGENLLLSIILDTDNLSAMDQFVISEVTALCILSFLRKIGITGTIKWPNDILVGDKKIAGVLIENQLKGAAITKSIIGIGLNVNQLAFYGLNATSIRCELGEFKPLMDIMMSLVNSFNEEWSKFLMHGRNGIEESYLKQLYGKEKQVEMEDENGRFYGIVDGIERSGMLRVWNGGELRVYDLKELRFIFQNKA